MTRAERLARKTLKGRSGERLGRWAEAWCRLALRLKGYRVLASRCRTPAGEIDIVAARGELLAIVEVKARPTEDLGHLAVSLAQWRRLERAAGLYVAARPRLARHAIRFDLMIVRPRRWPLHQPDAWRPS
ncbi:putative endonuclease [Nitrospirillum amazonense]|uniref:UPF0102 protein FBZ87_104350 n=1 Tax=Nitrospirillum amazonense TaxID=28077 RepID=A0A560JW72_9PROT|nr:YraN family protein [Nitrospirillum amazonense]TWB75247.1 putative endonuclease [Nitrospirillum amazonense]